MIYCPDKKILKFNAYGDPQIGSFSVESEYSMAWDKCREQFACRLTDIQPGLFFCHVANEGHKVAAFLAKTEEILGFTNYLHSFELSTYCETDKNNVLWINISRFWMKSEVRRQMLTILLRAGMAYDSITNNYEEALWTMIGEENRLYCMETKNAVMRFLYGFTHHSGPDIVATYRGGWVATFKGLDDATVRGMLVLPEGEKSVNSVIGMGKLWN